MMDRWRRQPEAEEDTPSHLITYSDMMTLLFAFFVLLYGLGSMDLGQQRALGEALRQNLPVVGAPASPPRSSLEPAPAGTQPASPQTAPAAQGERGDSGRLLGEVRDRLQSAGFGAGVEVAQQKQGVLIRVKDNLVFESGSAQIHPDGHRLIEAIAQAVRTLPGAIRVEGHTDDVPIRNDRYPSNWELSAARAVNVVRALAEQHGIAPQRLMFAGYGEQKPLVPNTTPANRQKNRRVEVYLLNEQ